MYVYIYQVKCAKTQITLLENLNFLLGRPLSPEIQDSYYQYEGSKSDFIARFCFFPLSS